MWAIPMSYEPIRKGEKLSKLMLLDEMFILMNVTTKHTHSIRQMSCVLISIGYINAIKLVVIVEKLITKNNGNQFFSSCRTQ